MWSGDKKICILMGGGKPSNAQYDEQVASGAAPRIDYMELCKKLNADIPAHPIAHPKWSSPVRRLEQKVSLDMSMAAWTALQKEKYSLIFSLAETVGIPMAAALKLTHTQIPHVLVGHKLSWRVQRYTWRFTRLQNSFSSIACVSKAQADYAKSPSGMNVAKSHFIYDKVDEQFFSPRKVKSEEYILSVGQEQRDYETLVNALVGTGKRLVIVASSPWATKKLNLPQRHGDVTVRSRIPFTELRDLYAKAKMVVVSVHDVDFAAGVNGLLEGMSMAKPVICCDTSGLAGYVKNDTTGILVPTYNAHVLRDRILELWENPKMRSRLGDCARDAVVAEMTLDHYVDRLARLALDELN